MTSWSVESLPSVAGFCNDELQALLVESFSAEALRSMRPKLVCILTQPELKSCGLRKLGFSIVKSCAHHSMEFFKTQVCPKHMQAILVIHIGATLDQKMLDCVSAVADNVSAPAVIVLLIIASDNLSGTSLASILSETKVLDIQLRSAAEQCFAAGADDVITLQNEMQLLPCRIQEAIARAEINARKVFHVEKAIDEVKLSTKQRAKDVEAEASKTLQAAWKSHIWSLPGQTFSRIPVEDASLSERTPKSDGGMGGVQNYDFVSKLGSGSFGSVYKAQLRPGSPQDEMSNNVVAIKVLKKSAIKTAGALFSLDQEFGIMLNMKPHPNIARAIQVLHGKQNIYMVMDFAGKMNLHHYVQQKLGSTGETCLPKAQVRPFLENITAAVAHVHSAMICHRDLKPSNMIVSSEGKLSLVDFGLSAMLCGEDDRMTHCCGSRPYCAPEVLDMRFNASDGYLPFPADVWSLGVNFIEIGLGPYSVEKLLGWVPQHPTDDRKILVDVQRLGKIWASAPDTGVQGLNAVISRMLLLDPRARLTMNMVIRGDSGLGLQVPVKPVPPPARGPGARPPAPRPVKRPTAPCRGNSSQANGQEAPPPLMVRLKGSTVLQAVESMLDEAIVETPVGFVVDRDPAAIPTLRALYAEGVVSYLDATSPEKGSAVLLSIRDRHRPWCFSDAEFDHLNRFFGAALSRLGVPADTVRECRCRFAELRPAVTHSYHASHKATCEERKLHDGAVVGDAVPAHAKNKARVLAEGLYDILVNRPDWVSGLRSAFPSDTPLEDWRRIVELRAIEFFSGSDTDALPGLVRDASMNLDDAAELIDFLRSDMSERREYNEWDVNNLFYAMRDEWDFLRLGMQLKDLQALVANIDLCNEASFWMSLCLQWQLHIDEYTQVGLPGRPCTACPACLPECLAVVGAVLQEAVNGCAKRATQTVSSTATNWRELGLRHLVFDLLEETLPKACGELPPAMVLPVVSVLQSMRPFFLRGVEEITAVI